MDDEEMAEEAMADNDRSQAPPLAGVVTCCTSIQPEQRAEFASIVSDLGGTNKLDLTSDATHLIVGTDWDTPKYRYVARERPDVACVTPGWLPAVRAQWRDDFAMDVCGLQARWRRPTLAGTVVCLTGFVDMPERARLEAAVRGEAAGAGFSTSLGGEVTHLVAAEPAGAKYVAARRMGIRVVAVQWVWESLERGMMLDEELFDVTLAEGERGVGAWVKGRVGSGMGERGKRRREEDGGERRRLKRSRSGRLSGQNEEAIWLDIVGGGVERGKKRAREWEDGKVGVGEEQSRAGTPGLPVVARPGSSSVKNRGFFHGKRFFLHGFGAKQTAILEQHMQAYDADILPELSQLSLTDHPSSAASSFLVVPHTSSDRDIPDTPHAAGQTVVNEMWVEKCLHMKEHVDPGVNAAYTPFKYPISGFDALTISSTGFVDIELLHVGKAVGLLGATYSGNLTKSASALVCHSTISPSRQQKVHHALLWDIPVVKADWLWACMRSGENRSMNDYLVHPDRQSHLASRGRDDGPGEEDPGTAKRTGAGAGARKPKHSYGKIKGKGTWLRPRENGAAREPVSRPATAGPHTLVDDSFSALGGNDNDGDSNAVSSHVLALSDADSQTSTSTCTLLGARPFALGERSPNSPPKHVVSNATKSLPSTSTKSISVSTKSTSFSTKSTSISTKPASNPTNPENPPPIPSEPDPLATAITSLLAARRAGACTPPSIDTAAASSSRRRRGLLGRAASNLSSANRELSRASSVDTLNTLNTDGVGTPVEGPSGGGRGTAGTAGTDPLAEALFGSGAGGRGDVGERGKRGKEKEMGMGVDEGFVGTQVGYVEAEAEVWREKVAREKGWKAKGGGEEEVREMRETRVVGDAGGESVARRTRHARR